MNTQAYKPIKDVESTFNLDVLQTQGEEHRKYNLAAVKSQKKIAELIGGV